MSNRSETGLPSITEILPLILPALSKFGFSRVGKVKMGYRRYQCQLADNITGYADIEFRRRKTEIEIGFLFGVRNEELTGFLADAGFVVQTFPEHSTPPLMAYTTMWHEIYAHKALNKESPTFGSCLNHWVLREREDPLKFANKVRNAIEFYLIPYMKRNRTLTGTVEMLVERDDAGPDSQYYYFASAGLYILGRYDEAWDWLERWLTEWSSQEYVEVWEEDSDVLESTIRDVSYTQWLVTRMKEKGWKPSSRRQKSIRKFLELSEIWHIPGKAFASSGDDT